MLKIVYFGVLFLVVGSLAVFLAENQGDVTLTWLGYSVKTTVPVLVLAGVLFFFLLDLVVFKPLRFFKSCKQRRLDEYKYAEMMTAGMSMVLASDIKGARKIEKKLIKKMGSVPMLSMAIAVADKDDEKRLKCAEDMLLNDKTALFGLKGIIDYYYDRKEYEKALDYATRALKKEPALWTYRAAVDLKIKNSMFKDALATLEEGKKTVPAAEYAGMKLALLMKLAGDDGENREKYLEQAVKTDKGFAPAVLALASFYRDKGKDAKALKVLHNGFAAKPDILLYDYLAENWRGKADIIKLARDLTDGMAGNPVAEQVLGESFVLGGIWGQGLLHLKNAVKNGGLTGRTALLLAKVEKELGHDDEVEKWNNAILNVEMANRWRCADCGCEYPAWQVSCPSCGGFGTIKWDAVKKSGTELVSLA